MFLAALPLIPIYWFSYFALLKKPVIYVNSSIQTEQQPRVDGKGLKGEGEREREGKGLKGEGEREGKEGEVTPLLRPLTHSNHSRVSGDGVLVRVARCFRATLWLAANVSWHHPALYWM